MRFAITGLISPDASAGIDLIANAFEAAFRLKLASLNLSCNADLLVFAPIIVPAALGTVEDESEYRRGQSAIVIHRNINHERWMRAAPHERLARYTAALSAGLGDLPNEVLSEGDLHTLRECIDAAGAEVQKGLSQEKRDV